MMPKIWTGPNELTSSVSKLSPVIAYESVIAIIGFSLDDAAKREHTGRTLKQAERIWQLM